MIFFLDEEINITNKEYINNHITTNYYFNLFTDPNKNSQEQLFTKSKFLITHIYYILVNKIIKKCDDDQIKSLVYLENQQLFL